MELLLADIAKTYQRSSRLVQQALKSGALPGHRTIGRHTTVDDIAALAWARSIGHGRRWSAEAYESALDLLSEGETQRLASSQRSRQRCRLRSMSANEIAHAAGGLAPWGRYRGSTPDDLLLIGPSALDPTDLGLVAGQSWLTFAQTPNLDQFELNHDVVLDADGNLGVVERTDSDTRSARILIDTYLLGDTRQSLAAAQELERRCHEL